MSDEHDLAIKVASLEYQMNSAINILKARVDKLEDQVRELSERAP